jgi:hypothetical protein
MLKNNKQPHKWTQKYHDSVMPWIGTKNMAGLDQFMGSQLSSLFVLLLTLHLYKKIFNLRLQFGYVPEYPELHTGGVYL